MIKSHNQNYLLANVTPLYRLRKRDQNDSSDLAGIFLLSRSVSRECTLSKSSVNFVITI